MGVATESTENTTLGQCMATAVRAVLPDPAAGLAHVFLAFEARRRRGGLRLGGRYQTRWGRRVEQK